MQGRCNTDPLGIDDDNLVSPRGQTDTGRFDLENDKKEDACLRNEPTLD